MRKELLKRINADLKKKSLRSLALEMDLFQPTLYRIVKGPSRGSIETWEKIDRYYKGKR